MSVARGGITWTSFGVFIYGVGQVAVLAVLARHLNPQEFGTANIALIVFALGANIFDGGVGLNIAQRKTLRPSDIAIAAQVSILLAVVMSFALFLTRAEIAAFFDAPELVPALQIVGLTVILGGLVGAQEAVLFHQRRYRAVTLVKLIPFLLGYVILAISLVVSGVGFMSIVYAHLGMYVVKVLIVIVLIRNPIFIWPCGKGFWLHLIDTVVFSLGRLALFLTNNADKVLVGRMLGMDSLGFYGRAHQIVMIPNKIFVQAVVRVTTPLYASIQDDHARVSAAFLKTIRFTLLLVGPLVVFVVMFHREIVYFLLGSGWEQAAKVLAILMVGGMFHVLYKVPLSILHSQKLSRNTTFTQVGFSILFVISVLQTVKHGLEMVAIAVTAVTAANYLVLCAQVLRRLRISQHEFFALHGKAIGPSLGFLIFAIGSQQMLGDRVSSLVLFLLLGCCMGVITLLSLRQAFR